MSSTSAAIDMIRNALGDRLKESRLLRDARVQMAVRELTEDEHRVLQVLAEVGDEQARSVAHPALKTPSVPDERGLSGLIRKGAVRAVARHEETGVFFYRVTPFGRALAELALRTLPGVRPDEEATGSQGPEPHDEEAG